MADGRPDPGGLSPPHKPDWRGWAGYLGRAIGRYTESEGGDSAETQQARSALFDVYDAWVDAGRPDHG